jgi:hypothetical protein
MPGTSRGARVGFIVAGSVMLLGSAALAGAMGFYTARSQKLEKDGERIVGDDPSMHNANDAALRGILHDGRAANRAAIGTGVAAGLALSGAIGLIVSGARKPTRMLAPTLSRGGAGLVWSVRF